MAYADELVVDVMKDTVLVVERLPSEQRRPAVASVLTVRYCGPVAGGSWIDGDDLVGDKVDDDKRATKPER